MQYEYHTDGPMEVAVGIPPVSPPLCHLGSAAVGATIPFCANLISQSGLSTTRPTGLKYGVVDKLSLTCDFRGR